MITMRDIAVHTGVSRSTVSFVLNDKHSEMGVNEITRRRVLQAAKELGYQRNQMARAIATGKSSVLGFLVPAQRLHFEVAARLLSGALDEAERAYQVVQVLRLSSGAADEEAIRRCVELRPTGIMAIYVDVDALKRLQHEMARFHIPIVVMDSSPPLEGGSHIYSDDLSGCFQAIAHLVSLGHTRIAFIGGPPDTAVSRLRDEGYRQAMAKHGLPILPGYMENGDWNVVLVERIIQRLFQNDAPAAPPTAIFCADDQMAMAACRTLRGLGLSVPHDVSVVGFANLVMASYCDPPLTTIAQPFEEMGQASVRCLLDGDISDAGEERLLPTRLIVRASTASAKV